MDEDIVENASNLCRVCFSSGEFSILSYQLEINDNKYEIKDVLKDLSVFETWKSDNYPSMICYECVEQLAQCYMFIRKLRNADEKIKELLTDTLDLESIDICQTDTSELIRSLEENESELDEIENDEASETFSNAYVDVEILLKEDSDTDVHKPKKGVKRKYNRNAHFILRESITNVQNSSQLQTDSENNDSSPSTQPSPIKFSKESTDGNCFLITKFIPTQTTTLPDTNSESGRGDLGMYSNTVSQVRMFDMAAVEVSANDKIELKDDNETNIENPNTMYMCQYCPRAFATSHHLIMHQRKSHVCQFCMKGFNKIFDLHKHTKEAHSQFNCALCNKNFSSNSNLRQHMKRIHNVELPAHVSLLSFRKKSTS